MEFGDRKSLKPRSGNESWDFLGIMSDRYNSASDGALPLFASALAAPAVPSARVFHERREVQSFVLRNLRSGAHMTKCAYEKTSADGSRLAPVIEQLRNAHGFQIDGQGTIKTPYSMPNRRQFPGLAMVTPEIKDAYYCSSHWLKKSQERKALDGNQCVLCFDKETQAVLHCHHVTYENLFAEPMEDLLTLCEVCHERLHQNSRLKFPSGILVEHAKQLGWGGFETWLLP